MGDVTFPLEPMYARTQSVCNLDHALLAGEAWEAFLESPGPVVVGTAQGGSCFGASYEFLFNIKHRIKKSGLEDVAPVTFITAEPYLGHFGLGGVGDSAQRVERFFDRLGIEGLPNTAINEVRDGEIELESGRTLPFAYSMIVPPFTGVDAVRRVEGLGNAAGFIPVDDEFRHPEHEEIYSAGVAVAIPPPEPTAVPAGVPKTGQMSETMAKVAAHNIAADPRGGRRKRLPLSELAAICVLDAGNNGIVFKADHVLAPNGGAGHARVIRRPTGPLGQARVRALLPREPQARPRHRLTVTNTQEIHMSNVLELTEDTFDQETSQPGLTVVDFWAPWCGPCRAMAPQIERAAGLRPQHRFVKVNVDENPALASAYGVRAIPTLAILRDGELLGTAPGLVRSDDLVAALDRLAAEAADTPTTSRAAGRT